MKITYWWSCWIHPWEHDWDGNDNGASKLFPVVLRHQSDKSLPTTVLAADRADVQWNLIRQMKTLQCKLMCGLLSQIKWPNYSSADAEKVFRQVNRNQTDFGTNMGPNLLQSILMCKMMASFATTASFLMNFYAKQNKQQCGVWNPEALLIPWCGSCCARTHGLKTSYIW